MFNRRNTTGQIIIFKYTNNEVGSISTNGTATTYNTTSDIRLKENIVDTRYSIDNLLKIRVKDFNFRNDVTKKVNTGFIAQELYNIFPDAVTVPENDNGIWQVDYGRVTPLLVKAIQDQQLQINTLKEENTSLKEQIKEIETLKAELDVIKTMLKK
jgi:hypothetical protein